MENYSGMASFCEKCSIFRKNYQVINYQVTIKDTAETAEKSYHIC